MKCPDCDGTGECFWCDGVGHTVDGTECEDCLGSGDCEDCDGTGEAKEDDDE